MGAYSYRNSLDDVFLMIGMSFLGWTMRQLGYSRPGFFLGYVLGGLAERYFGISVAARGWTFFLTPISLGIIAITIWSVGSRANKGFSQEEEKSSEEKEYFFSIICFLWF